MTKANSTLITVLIDRSGSMCSCLNGTIEGFNSFIESQKKTQSELNDEVKVSMIQFDDKYELNYNMLPLQNVPNLTTETFIPRGWTALHDAIGKTVRDVGSKLSEMSENERPSKVLVVILTDGGENSSKSFSKEQIATIIKHQEEKYLWEFVYLGANQDSFAVAGAMGMKVANVMNYSSDDIGTRSVFASMSKMSTSYRTKGKVEFEDDK